MPEVKTLVRCFLCGEFVSESEALAFVTTGKRLPADETEIARVLCAMADALGGIPICPDCAKGFEE